MSNVALIVGHYVNGPDRGAVNYKGEPESSYNERIARKVKAMLTVKGQKCEIYTRDQYRTFAHISEAMIKFKADISIELHFNSFSKAAFGCECLALETDGASIRFADLITDKLSEIMGISERHLLANQVDGVLKIAKGGRGFNNLDIVKRATTQRLNAPIPVVLIEPCFANIRTKESEKFFESEDLYVQSIVAALDAWFSGKSNQPLKPNVIAKLPTSPKNVIETVANKFRKGYE